MPEVGIGEFIATMAVVSLWVVLIVVPVVAILYALRNAIRGRRDPAMDALRTRYARGDIDEAEYLRLRSTLQRG